MKIYALMIYATPPGANAVPLSTAWKLDDFGWLQRGNVQDIMAFMAKTVAERTPPTQRQSVQENAYVAHVHSRPASDGISGVLVSDTDYPVRVAFSLLNKLLDEFLLKVPSATYQTRVNALTTGSGEQPPKGEGIVGAGHFPQMADYIQRYQDPRQADAIMKVQQELDETKIVLVSGEAGKRQLQTGTMYAPTHSLTHLALARLSTLPRSTRPSSRCWHEASTSTRSSRGRIRCSRAARCSTRRQRSRTAAASSCRPGVLASLSDCVLSLPSFSPSLLPPSVRTHRCFGKQYNTQLPLVAMSPRGVPMVRGGPRLACLDDAAPTPSATTPCEHGIHADVRAALHPFTLSSEADRGRGRGCGCG